MFNKYVIKVFLQLNGLLLHVETNLSSHLKGLSNISDVQNTMVPFSPCLILF